MFVVTEANFMAVLNEYSALTFSMLYRKLSEKEAARHLELEKALEAIPEG